MQNIKNYRRLNMKIAHLVVEGEDIRKVGDILCDSLKGSFPEKPHIYRNKDIIIITRECYYKEIHGTLISVITLCFNEINKVEIELVCGGAKHKLIDFGVENRENRVIVNNIIAICNENSLKIISMGPQNITETFTETTVNKLKNNFNSFLKRNK